MDSHLGLPGCRGGYIFSRAGSRAVDEQATSRYGIPGIILMENAARSAAAIALGRLDAAKRDDSTVRIIIICGSGNNGGDGFAMARHLHNAGAVVEMRMLGSPRPDTDAAVNLEIVKRMNIGIRDFEPSEDPEPAGLLVDAIFGTGLDRPVEGRAAEAIDWINRFSGPVMSVDLPSGLDCDRGEVLGVAVRATITVSFLGWKRGFLTDRGREHAGEVVVAGIGAPRELIAEFGERQPVPSAR